MSIIPVVVRYISIIGFKDLAAEHIQLHVYAAVLLSVFVILDTVVATVVTAVVTAVVAEDPHVALVRAV